MSKKIKESIDNIRDECDNIEERIEPKVAKVHGDPVVELG